MDNYIFVEYCGQGHLHPYRIQSAKYRNVASLKLNRLDPDQISYLKESSERLIMLDMSNVGLTKFPLDLISSLSNLQVLILNNNELTESSFCKEFSNILGKCLKEISICNNCLTALPPNAEKFIKLTRFKVTNNQITNMKGVEKLKRLKLLMIENNDLSQIGAGLYSAKKMENVYLSNNHISTISEAIRNMVNLKELDLSNNSIKIIPGDLFVLPMLEILKLSNNKISKIPNFKITPRLNNPISYIDLSSNSIVRFPDCVMRIVDDLDLSNNKIKTISSTILKKISYKSTKTINLKNNPLMDPPKEICESGLKCMIQYYEEYEGTEAKYQGIKVFCFGNESNEKNRIINILTDCVEDDGPQGDPSSLIETYDINSKYLNVASNENTSFNLKFLNMSGKSNNVDFLHFFITHHSLNLIFIDMDKWSKDSFNMSVGCWLWNMIFRNNEAIFCLVGLTTKKVDETIQLNCDQLKTLTKSLFLDYSDKITNEIRKIESKDKITTVMSQSLKRFIQLKSMKVSFDENIICVNYRDSKTLKKLTSGISKVLSNKQTYPNVSNHVPSFWSDVQTYIEEESYQTPIISFQDFEVLLQQKFNLKTAAKNVAKYLHETGSIFWFEHTAVPLNQWIVTSPQLLVECFQMLFRHDLKSYLEDPSDPDKNIKRFKKKFPNSKYGYKRSCEILTSEAVLLPELAIILFENILPIEYTVKMLFFICQCWNLGYIVDYSGVLCKDWSVINNEYKDNFSDNTSSSATLDIIRKSAESKRSVEPKQSMESRRSDSRHSQDSKVLQIPSIFLAPLSKKKEMSPHTSEQWKVKSSLKITIYYTFPVGYPNLIFDQTTVRVSDRSKFNVLITDHWIDGYQAQIMNEPILFRIERSYKEGNDRFIRYEVHFIDTETSENFEVIEAFKASEIWKVLHDILNSMDELLNSYQGLWFSRAIECPHCKELSFPGTWHIFNDNDSSADQVCINCEKDVPVYLLEPPKISKNATAEEIIRNIRKQFDRD